LASIGFHPVRVGKQLKRGVIARPKAVAIQKAEKKDWIASLALAMTEKRQA
jgi:hypothetical protein